MVTYYEKIDSTAPASFGFAFDAGKAVLPMLVDNDELSDALTDLLGDCEAGSDGRLIRTLPKAHPKFPWLFAERISEGRGLGSPTYTAAETELEASPLTHFADYPQYLLTVEFTSRPYAVLSDDSIQVTEAQSYFNDAGAATTYKYANEWDRFLDWDYTPSPEFIVAQQGQMKFRVTGSASPDGKTFSGRPKITVPSATVVYRWYQVPMSYLTSSNSYLDKYQGYINQKEWDGWSEGQLLYLGPKVLRRYPPVVPELTLDSGETQFSIEKLVDLELTFLYTSRTITTAASSISNSNWIAKGHNIVPWFGDRGFYYVSNKGDDADTGSKQFPSYLSFPFELLFTNPDADA